MRRKGQELDRDHSSSFLRRSPLAFRRSAHSTNLIRRRDGTPRR